MKNWVDLKLFERKLEFWNLFENWNLENYSKIRVLKIKFKNLEFWKLNLKEIGNLEINWELEFWKLNYEMEFWNLNLRIGILEIGN